MGTIIVSFILGILASIIAGLYLFYRQYLSSTAGYRVGKTVEATVNIVDTGTRSRKRDRYRYSLGVVIDNLEQLWKNDFEKDIWPCLVHTVEVDGRLYLANQKGESDSKADRWELFNQYVRPVIQDINVYSFISSSFWLPTWFRWYPKRIRQLGMLTKLCNQLETVVCELDAAFEMNSLIELDKFNGKRVIKPKIDSIDSEDVKRLRKEYCKLYTAWNEWLHAAED